jgi:hypothetical protein
MHLDGTNVLLRYVIEDEHLFIFGKLTVAYIGNCSGVIFTRVGFYLNERSAFGNVISEGVFLFKKLSVGVIGPKRMNYSKVIDMINRLTFGIDRMFNEEPGLPEPKDKY